LTQENQDMLVLACSFVNAALWFDPLPRYNFPTHRLTPPSASAPTITYIPGLDGTNGSPFVQWPQLAEAGFKICVQDVRSDAQTSFNDTVGTVVEFLASSRSPTLLMGESFGAVVAAAAAMREPALVSGLILINPATAYSQRPRLQADAAILRSLPAPVFPAASFALMGRKTFDLNFLGTAFKDLVVERSLDKLRDSDPELAKYYDGALAEMVEQVSTLPPRDFMCARLEHLEVGCAQVEAGWARLKPPLLVVAGTADALLDSEREARRLQNLLGEKRCTVHMVAGAGHAGTLDQRCQLADVLAHWASKVGISEVLHGIGCASESEC